MSMFPPTHSGAQSRKSITGHKLYSSSMGTSLGNKLLSRRRPLTPPAGSRINAIRFTPRGRMSQVAPFGDIWETKRCLTFHASPFIPFHSFHPSPPLNRNQQQLRRSSEVGIGLTYPRYHLDSLEVRRREGLPAIIQSSETSTARSSPLSSSSSATSAASRHVASSRGDVWALSQRS